MKSQLIIVLLAFVTMPLSVLAQTGDIQGTVYQRSTGKSLVDADVHILETDQHQKTDANGVFQFTELPEGTYTFVVKHPTETAPTKVSMDISSGDTTEVKIHLGAAFTLETVVVEGKRKSVAVNSYGFPAPSMTPLKGS
ncbi:carboxypeptidase-like regulatory domain-containing protein [Candidatus Poribacteria bacterium]|nr:carboxypeptidase-like regulatory domain-containing protein [Candidatus Poribacteria bacterium]